MSTQHRPGLFLRVSQLSEKADIRRPPVRGRGHGRKRPRPRAQGASACLTGRGCPTIRHAQHAVEHGITNFSGVGWLLAATRKRKGTRPCLTGQAWHPATTNHATNCRTGSTGQAWHQADAACLNGARQAARRRGCGDWKRPLWPRWRGHEGRLAPRRGSGPSASRPCNWRSRHTEAVDCYNPWCARIPYVWHGRRGHEA